MLQALVITLREGVEAALIVGITLAYLAKIGRPELRRVVYWALGAAVVGSAGLAVALSRTSRNQEKLEGWIMLAASLFVVSMVIFMMKTARALKGKIEQRVDSLAGRGSAIGLFLFVFLMVVREGVETVLILSAVSLNSAQIMEAMGTLAGVGLATLFGVMFVKGSVRVNLPRFFRVTTVILFFVAAQLAISGLHELSENGVLPSSKREMALIGPVVRNDYFFFVTILALAGLMILFDYRRRSAAVDAETRAARRKAEWTARRERLWAASVYASSFVFIVLITAQFIYAKSAASPSPATEVTLHNGRVVIPAAQLAQGELAHYRAQAGGHDVRFLLYRKPDGKVAAIFDACEICGPVGFYKGAAGLICRNCAAPVNPQAVGQPGGCNPIPLEAATEGDSVVITEAALQAGAQHFRE